jgi:hypothetical protein
MPDENAGRSIFTVGVGSISLSRSAHGTAAKVCVIRLASSVRECEGTIGVLQLGQAYPAELVVLGKASHIWFKQDKWKMSRLL